MVFDGLSVVEGWIVIDGGGLLRRLRVLGRRLRVLVFLVAGAFFLCPMAGLSSTGRAFFCGLALEASIVNWVRGGRFFTDVFGGGFIDGVASIVNWDLGGWFSMDVLGDGLLLVDGGTYLAGRSPWG